MARIATEVCASVNASEMAISVMRRAGTKSSAGVHIRMFEGSVHMRRVPVKTDINPDSRAGDQSFARSG